MVDLTGDNPDGPIQHGFNNWVFIFPAVVVVGLISFFGYKLAYSLREKSRKKDEKKRLKQQKKESKKKQK